MPELLAGRFLASGRGWIDVATGDATQVRVFDSPTKGAELVWSDWCATVACMRHPAMQALIDYGGAGGGRAFEAYSLRGPLPVRRPGARAILEQAAAFLEWRGVPLPAATGRLLMRPVVGGAGPGCGRPCGVVLQPRAVLRQIEDALRDTAPGGVSTVIVHGERGAGLRTLRQQVARAARLQGYVPLAAGLVARAPWLAAAAEGRHVCVLVGPDPAPDESGTAARLASRLGLDSARRHLLVRFTRAASVESPALEMDRMGVTAMVSMIFMPRESGLDHDALVAAARRAGGMPGPYLEQLGAVPAGEWVGHASIAHERPVPYTVAEPAAPAVPRRAGRSLAAAAARAARLSGRGRHASAARLLTRASRVLELRGDRAGAAECAARLGWQLRDRGRGSEALEQFERAGRLAPRYEVAAAIAAGVIRTDERRFVDAEAALRGAIAAAGVAADREALGRARLALARCLYWDGRTDEALAHLDDAIDPTFAAEALALRARLLIARGDVTAAAGCGDAALARTDPGDRRGALRAARALALVSLSIGDRLGAQAHAQRALDAAAAAHLPLFALRLRALLASLDARSRDHARLRLESRLGSALARVRVPPLVRHEIEQLLAPAAVASVPAGRTPPPSSSLALTQELLELAFSAEDDEAGVAAVLDAMLRRLHAATLEVVAGDNDRRVLGRAGRPWTGDRRIVDRVLAGAAAPPSGLPAESAHAIVQGGRPLAALACRWTATATVAPDADAALHVAALALGPSVRALLERPPAAARDTAWPELVGGSAAALRLRESVARAARAPFPVLIEGESGSGKELVARAIHRLGPRRDRRLCAVNCAALSEDLLEAELFGHVRGAFTGAVGERAGLFEEADGGSIFLDEVGELSPRAQAKLLRVLQDGEVRRVGENVPRRVDARVIAATNRRLEAEVEAGRFRADLRFRLDVVRIAVPALRERADDVPLLAAQFWEDASRRVGSHAVLGADVLHALARYDWPGNVRQLQNVIATLAVHAPRRGRVPAGLLPAQIARTAGERAPTFEAAREEFERRYVAAELARAGGHRAKAARALGVTRQGLAKMMRRLGLE